MAANGGENELHQDVDNMDFSTLTMKDENDSIVNDDVKFVSINENLRNKEKHANYSEVMSTTKQISTEKAWKPLSRTDKVIGEKEKLKRNVQAVLNKLTFQKFKILLSQLKKLNINTIEDIELIVNLIYENAINEPHFCILYANLCKYLALKMPFDNASTTKEFCKLLINKCETGFQEQYHIPNSNISNKCLPNSVLENKKIKSRRIGNIRFIGELFKFRVVPSSTAVAWVGSLLSEGEEDGLEFFYWFMKTAGKELESQEKHAVDEYFQHIENAIDNRCLSSRIRFLLQDIVELKESNWIPRRLENLPRTIDEIHLEAALELQQRLSVAPHESNRRRRDEPAPCRSCLCGGSSPQTSTGRTSHFAAGPSNSRPSPPEEVRNLLLGHELREARRKSRRRRKVSRQNARDGDGSSS